MFVELNFRYSDTNKVVKNNKNENIPVEPKAVKFFKISALISHPP
jgi:hypothetical protein